MSDEEIKILVKKPDGSFVHVPLSEIQKRSKPTASNVAATKSPGSIAQVSVTSPVVKNITESIRPPSKKDEMPVREGTTPSTREIKLPHFTKKENTRLEKEVVAVIPPAPVAKIVQPPVRPAPPAPPKSAAPQAEPVKLSIKSEKGDLGSLLDEELPNKSKLTPLTSESRTKQVDEIAKTISFKISPGNDSRIKTIILLFLKDVRGEDETMEILQRPEIDGGVGLSEEQAKEIVQKCRKITVSPTPSSPASPPKVVPRISPVVSTAAPVVQPVSNSTNNNDTKRFEAELPKIIKKADMTYVVVKPSVVARPSPAPVPPAPKPFVKSAELTDGKKILNEQIVRATAAEMPVNFKISSDRSKITMNDIKAAPLQMGPIDEVRYFSLVDFRRLSADPLEAANRLKQKFINLHDESIMLYFEALDAWKISPLYHDYINLVSEAVKRRLPLARVATEKIGIQIPEIKALVKMEKELG